MELGYQLHDAVVSIVVVARADHVQRRCLRDHGREELFPLVLHGISETMSAYCTRSHV